MGGMMFVERSVTDPNEREDHRDLNADCEHAQTCSDRPLAKVLKNKLIQQSNLRRTNEDARGVLKA
jgi:hypothetical protein